MRLLGRLEVKVVMGGGFDGKGGRGKREIGGNSTDSQKRGRENCEGLEGDNTNVGVV